MNEIRFNTVRGRAINSLTGMLIDAGGEIALPKWLVGCLCLIAQNHCGAEQSLLENLDNEEPLDYWLNLALIELFNELHNASIPNEKEETLSPLILKSALDDVVKRYHEIEISQDVLLPPTKPIVKPIIERPIAQDVVPITDLATRPGRGVLGQMRVAIADLPEPFTSVTARALILKRNAGLDINEIKAAVKSAMQTLEQSGGIERVGMLENGEVLWKRTGKFSKEARTGTNRCIVIEPKTGKVWTSIKNLVDEIGGDYHEIHYAIKTGKPLPDGRVVEYINRQRKAGECGRPRKEEAAAVVSELLKNNVPMGKIAEVANVHRNTVTNIAKRIESEGQPEKAEKQWSCNSCGHTIPVNPMGRTPQIRCAKCRSSAWSEIATEKTDGVQEEPAQQGKTFCEAINQ
jgi:DNA-directed RNA polymerase subunit RPC12/RpoP